MALTRVFVAPGEGAAGQFSFRPTAPWRLTLRVGDNWRGDDRRGVRVPAVADAPDGTQQQRRRRFLLDLVADPAYVHGDGRLVAERPAPHPFHQLGAGERLSGMGHEEGDQIAL